MGYLCPACKTPLRKIKTESNAFFTEEIWNCSKCSRNHYKRRHIWIGSTPIYVEDV